MPRKKPVKKILAATKPAINDSDIITDYQVNNTGDNVSVTLHFSPVGVAATTSLNVDRAALITATDGDINQVIGTNTGLAGSRLNGNCIVAATSQSGAPVSLQLAITITGGVQDLMQTYAQPAANTGDSVIFNINIGFYS